MRGPEISTLDLAVETKQRTIFLRHAKEALKKMISPAFAEADKEIYMQKISKLANLLVKGEYGREFFSALEKSSKEIYLELGSTEEGFESFYQEVFIKAQIETEGSTLEQEQEKEEDLNSQILSYAITQLKKFKAKNDEKLDNQKAFVEYIDKSIVDLGIIELISPGNKGEDLEKKYKEIREMFCLQGSSIIAFPGTRPIDFNILPELEELKELSVSSTLGSIQCETYEEVESIESKAKVRQADLALSEVINYLSSIKTLEKSLARETAQLLQQAKELQNQIIIYITNQNQENLTSYYNEYLPEIEIFYKEGFLAILEDYAIDIVRPHNVDQKTTAELPQSFNSFALEIKNYSQEEIEDAIHYAAHSIIFNKLPGGFKRVQPQYQGVIRYEINLIIDDIIEGAPQEEVNILRKKIRSSKFSKLFNGSIQFETWTEVEKEALRAFIDYIERDLEDVPRVEEIERIIKPISRAFLKPV